MVARVMVRVMASPLDLSSIFGQLVPIFVFIMIFVLLITLFKTLFRTISGASARRFPSILARIRGR
ncbi:hypothetical protein [Alphaspiravirus yamagawaense]|uniref:Uncharacterized protein n=1 Tax=Alphaspiravirus yamagawaense TaxID=1157339 RepID=J7Q7K2_9VIRU|nr:hypothetical protein [Aeropyrum coil-shaped virus]CCG27857.1 hypothetical protein [Aeropyrum coil-shaped virus]